MILKTAANYNEEGGYIEAWKNSDGTTEVKLIPKSGGGEGKQGLKSISISPAIQTTPTLDSLFPIYWDDLPEGDVEEGMEHRYYDATLHTGYALTNGTEYTISATPTSDRRVCHYETEGDIGEAITFTATASKGSLIIEIVAIDAARTESVSAAITITE